MAPRSSKSKIRFGLAALPLLLLGWVGAGLAGPSAPAPVADPVEVVNTFEQAECLLRRPCEPVAGLPPFQGGTAGLLGYSLGTQFEPTVPATPDPFGMPLAAVGRYEWVIAFDHGVGRAWVISHRRASDVFGILQCVTETHRATLCRPDSLANPPPDDGASKKGGPRMGSPYKTPGIASLAVNVQ